MLGGIYPLGGAGIVAETVAKSFGISLIACISLKPCADKLAQALAQYVSSLGTGVTHALTTYCENLHKLYTAQRKRCSGCERGRAQTFCGRIKRCAHSTVNATCWALTASLRAKYIVEGCDFLLEPNFAGHVEAFKSAFAAGNWCIESAAKNCPKPLPPIGPIPPTIIP